MTQDATSEPSVDTAAIADDAQAQLLLADALDTPDDGQDPSGEQPAEAGEQPAEEDTLGDSGKRALMAERKAKRDAERRLRELQSQLQQYTDRDKSELQKAVERAEAAERDASSVRVANARLMAAATYNLPPEWIDLLGDGTDEQIDERARRIADQLAAARGAAQPTQPSVPAAAWPVEALTPGAQPAHQPPPDPDSWLRAMAGRDG